MADTISDVKFPWTANSIQSFNVSQDIVPVPPHAVHPAQLLPGPNQQPLSGGSKYIVLLMNSADNDVIVYTDKGHQHRIAAKTHKLFHCTAPIYVYLAPGAKNPAATIQWLAFD